jgi:hypothetical protein
MTVAKHSFNCTILDLSVQSKQFVLINPLCNFNIDLDSFTLNNNIIIYILLFLHFITLIVNRMLFCIAIYCIQKFTLQHIINICIQHWSILFAMMRIIKMIIINPFTFFIQNWCCFIYDLFIMLRQFIFKWIRLTV